MKNYDYDSFGYQHAIDGIKQPANTYRQAFRSEKNIMKFPWIEVELSTLIDISGVEITYYNSPSSSHDNDMFQNYIC